MMSTTTTGAATSEPGPLSTELACTIPAADPPPSERATRSPSDAATWASWAACAQRANWTTANRTTMITGITRTAATVTDPYSRLTRAPVPADRNGWIRAPTDVSGPATRSTSTISPDPVSYTHLTLPMKR